MAPRPPPLAPPSPFRPASKQQPCCTSKSPRRRPGALHFAVARAIHSRNRPSQYPGSLTAAWHSASSCCALSLPATKTSPSGFSDIWELVGRWRCLLDFGDRKPLSGRVGISETERASDSVHGHFYGFPVCADKWLRWISKHIAVCRDLSDVSHPEGNIATK